MSTDSLNAAGNPMPPLKQRAWEFWRRNQILLLHLPVMIAFLFGSYVFLKAIDSRIGVEGFGDIFGYALNAIRICFICFTAWYIKRNFWFDLYDKTELKLFEAMLASDWMAFWIVVRDRLEWVVALGFATYWYTR